MQSRRQSRRHAAALTGSALVWGTIPEAIARALRIDPDPGTTWRDAEHVVILMQENRSFDHCFGALRGARGFRDPCVHRQPDGRPAWFQTDAEGRTYAPFRLDLKSTDSTWIGGLPHTWPDQSGLTPEQENWLSNFGDNPLEWFPQFHVRFSRARRAFVARRLKALPGEIATRESAAARERPGAAARTAHDEEITRLHRELGELQQKRAAFNRTTWARLPARTRALHERTFTTNAGAWHYCQLASLTYRDGVVARSLSVPRGDVFHRFRRDVDSGRLPAVSWLVAPQEISDHPASAWFGAWHVSESLRILTRDPDVWRKKIFILCYDENDGDFDHVPPFLAPQPDRPETGRVSAGIDPALEIADRGGLRHPIGLGFRGPLVIASPRSRGGCVNSQVFDHTSILQFLERWLAEKGRPVRESNPSDWRRAVCGDLVSASWRVATARSHGWYDFSVDAGDLSCRFSGRVETGEWSISDPAMA